MLRIQSAFSLGYTIGYVKIHSENPSLLISKLTVVSFDTMKTSR